MLKKYATKAEAFQAQYEQLRRKEAAMSPEELAEKRRKKAEYDKQRHADRTPEQILKRRGQGRATAQRQRERIKADPEKREVDRAARRESDRHRRKCIKADPEKLAAFIAAARQQPGRRRAAKWRNFRICSTAHAIRALILDTPEADRRTVFKALWERAYVDWRLKKGLGHPYIIDLVGFYSVDET